MWTGFSLPRRDVAHAFPLDASLTGEGPEFPDLERGGCDTPLYPALPVEFRS